MAKRYGNSGSDRFMPMPRRVRCPACHGVKKENCIVAGNNFAGMAVRNCSRCFGKGWIVTR